jgi:predicted acylesterase/phospholipase RssA
VESGAQLFNLGVLQTLAQNGLLKRIDYLSTVSGGGYIGSWLAAWIRREADD